MKKIILLSLFIASTVAVAGCKAEMNKGPAIEESGSMEQTETQPTPEQPPVSSSTEIEDIESELDGTVIQEEDFSDL